MARARNLLVLVVVFGGLLAYIYFVDAKRPSEADANKKPKVFSLTADTVEELTVKAASGETTSLKKVDGIWQVLTPNPARADEAEVVSIVSNLASLERQRVVDENPADLKPYGLDGPRVDIGFKQAGAATLTHLHLGEKTPTGGDMYAKLPAEKSVFLVSGFLDNTFNHGSFDLRDKTLARFDRDKLDRLEVGTADRTLVIEKAPNGWKLTRPIEARGDYVGVEGLIGRLQTVQIKSIVELEATDLKKYGFDKPQAHVIFGTGATKTELLIGRESADGTLYVRDAAGPMVMTVEKALLDDLSKSADDYRRKDVFDFRAFNATRLEVTRDGQTTLAFERVKATAKDAADSWRRLSPAGQVDGAKMEALLTRFANLRAGGFVDGKAKTGLDKPVVVITVKYEDGRKEEKVSFGRTGIDVFASLPEGTGAARIDATEFDLALKELDAIAK